jgi:hypothetical protein
MANDSDIRREIASDHVLTVLNNGEIVDGNLVFVTDEMPLVPGGHVNVTMGLPNRSTVRVRAALILITERGSPIVMPPGVGV